MAGPFLRLALILAPTILVQATFNDWSGGYSPAGRIRCQFTPALVPAIAIALREASRAFRVFAAVLLAIQWALAAAFVWLRPGWGYAGFFRNPLLAAIDDHVGVALDRAMPTFDSRATLMRGEDCAGWILVSAALVAYGATRLARTAPFELTYWSSPIVVPTVCVCVEPGSVVPGCVWPKIVVDGSVVVCVAPGITIGTPLPV